VLLKYHTIDATANTDLKTIYSILLKTCLFLIEV